MRSLAALAAVLALGGCSFVAKKKPSKFQGTQGDVASVFSSLSSDAKNGDDAKICNAVLSKALAATLGGPRSCKNTIGDVLDDADPTQLGISVQTIKLGPGKSPTTATATIKSGSGKFAASGTLTLVRQGGSWRLNSLG
jgi:hypothetical protein